MAENMEIGNVKSDADIPEASGHDGNEKPQDKTENVLKTYVLDEYKHDACPESLQNLLKFFENHGDELRDLKHVMGGLIFLLMAETGFVPIDYNGPVKSYTFHYKRMMELSKNPSIDWSSEPFTMKLKLCGFEKFETHLMLIPDSTDLIVNCFIKGTDFIIGILLDPLRYFTSSEISSFQNILFESLDNLSLKIKDGLAYPVKCAIYQLNGFSGSVPGQ